MNENIWRAQQQTHALLRLIQEMQWNDEGLRSTQIRYLDPHERDSRSMHDHLQAQDNALQAVTTAIAKAKLHMKEASRAGQAVESHLKYMSDELRRAEQEREESIRQINLTRQHLLAVEQLMKQAYEAGS